MYGRKNRHSIKATRPREREAKLLAAVPVPRSARASKEAPLLSLGLLRLLLRATALFLRVRQHRTDEHENVQ
jgi:hypothetical protein